MNANKPDLLSHDEEIQYIPFAREVIKAPRRIWSYAMPQVNRVRAVDFYPNFYPNHEEISTSVIGRESQNNQ